MDAPFAILVAALAMSAWTDLKARKIRNVVTYPAMLLCVAAAGWQGGLDGWLASLSGWLVCGGLMMAGYLCLDVGGGDVKLAALIGAGLGWSEGLYVLLWTFTLAGGLAIAGIVWRIGATDLIRLCFARRSPGAAGAVQGTPGEHIVLESAATSKDQDDRVCDPLAESAAQLNELLQRPLFLGPAALAALLIVAGPALSPGPAGSATRDVERNARAAASIGEGR
ncbi:MAG: prepilin peptidase [Planctomyces sp.]|nr:prepilin peptidase [Planctomyces sp.]